MLAPDLFEKLAVYGLKLARIPRPGKRTAASSATTNDWREKRV
jgi:hypothetical protein